MNKISGLSGNEIYCLAQKGYEPGPIVVGNCVHSLGVGGMFTSAIKGVVGGELHECTQLVEEGREMAFHRMEQEAKGHGGIGITGVSSELIFRAGTMEFLSIGSVIRTANQPKQELQFTTSSDGQELYAQLDAGYDPRGFAFGNVIYSTGVASSIMGRLKTLARGEIKEFSGIFNKTRHLALQRLTLHAKEKQANAVVGININIIPFTSRSVKEMIMIGTAAHNPQLGAMQTNEIVTSDMTNVEMWNLAKLGYAPMRLLFGTSVYSLGLVGGVMSMFKSFVRGEITELSRMIYEARENGLGLIADEAKSIGADNVIGTKIHMHELGGGLIEFVAIGTAVKKLPGIKTESEQLLPQAIIHDKTTYIDTTVFASGVDLGTENS